MEGPPKGLLQRSMTFDDRRKKPSTSTLSSVYHPGPTMKRSMTFVGEKSSHNVQEECRSRGSSFSYPDVIYRKHFHEEDPENQHKLHLFPPLIRSTSFAQKKSVSIAPTQRAEDIVKCVAIVDAFSTGAVLADLVYKQGYRVIRIISGELSDDLADMVLEGLDLVYEATITYNTNFDSPEESLEDLVRRIRAVGFPLEAVFAGAETGVELADALSERLGLRNNGTALSEARRNKYVMGETVRASGVRAVKQLLASTWGEIQAFLAEWNPSPYRVIVKPMNSAGSDDVTLCCSEEEVQRAFGNIMGKVNGLGLTNNSVLVQEYLEGQEYVVDFVSRDGEHKCVAIWAYDRRPVNGASFVCFGQRSLTADAPHCAELIEYQKKVITALGIRDGPTHGEVKWFQGEPVLVEVGARCHGGEGAWMEVANAVYGHNQVQATIDAYLNPEAFASLPERPLVRHAYGIMKWMVVTEKAGTLSAINSIANIEIESLSSFKGKQYFVGPGEQLKKTRDCFTWGGYCKLVNLDQEAIERDYYRIEELESSVLFEVEDEIQPKSKGFVGVVDPFSTGACLASSLFLQGYTVIAIYSANLEQLEGLQGLVPQGLTLEFEELIGYNENLEVMVDRISTLKEPLMAVFAGAETGVELADALSERLGLRNNGTALSEARRNKYVMGETVRASGVRAVKQLLASTWGEIQAFLAEWNPSPYRVIVKPMNSAGSDDVTLCCSEEEVQRAFGNIMGKVNGLGLTNNSVLVQEYLEGQEYVVDFVSRDGEHKCVAIYAYDRRPVNGASFVCYGYRLLTADEPYCAELIEYQKKVITALGIRDGPTHGEVKWFQGEPVLVEVGARCHGGEGAWMEVANAVYGYNQVQATIDAYLNPEAFASLPERPLVRYTFGRIVFFVVRVEGKFQEIHPDYLEELLSMPSITHTEFFLTKPGQICKPTRDCFTWGGFAKQIHSDLLVLIRDYDRIREMEENGLFKCE